MQENLIYQKNVQIQARGDCEQPCFDQLSAHILERLLFCWRSKVCSWSKDGHLQSPFDSIILVPHMVYLQLIVYDNNDE